MKVTLFNSLHKENIEKWRFAGSYPIQFKRIIHKHNCTEKVGVIEDSIWQIEFRGKDALAFYPYFVKDASKLQWTSSIYGSPISMGFCGQYARL